MKVLSMGLLGMKLWSRVLIGNEGVFYGGRLGMKV